jgi:hypothetical protein
MNRTRSAALSPLLLTLALASSAFAQPLEEPTPTSPSISGITILSEPLEATLSLRGRTKIGGKTPLELPPSVLGRFEIDASGPRLAKTQGVIVIPEGGAPYLQSEPTGMSMGLLVHGLNFPGLPDLSCNRTERGIALMTAASGAIFGSIRYQGTYRDRLDEFGTFSYDRAIDEKRTRNAWFAYGGAVWAASAFGYMTRPRFEMLESTPTRVSLGVKELSRYGCMWRSLIVPGAGQQYANHGGRGTFWITTALAAGAGVVISNYYVDRRQTDVDWAQSAADSAGPSEALPLAQKAEVARNDLQSAEDARRAFVAALTATWILNVIDAALMPLAPPAPPKPAKVHASLPITPTKVGVELTYRF